jgi:hypothetical protein
MTRSEFLGGEKVELTENLLPNKDSEASWVSSASLQTASLRTITRSPSSMQSSAVARTQTSVSPPVITSVSTALLRNIKSRPPPIQESKWSCQMLKLAKPTAVRHDAAMARSRAVPKGNFRTYS